MNEVASHPDREEPVDSQGNPWSPGFIAIITLLFTLLPGGIMHALNYERLGLPSLKKLALYSNLTGFTLVALLSLFAEGSRGLVLGVNLFYIVHFYRTQAILYEQHRERGGKKGSFLVPIALSLLVIGLLYGASVGVDYFSRDEFVRAISHYEEGEYDKAEVLFQTYLTKHPKEADAHYNLALIYYNTGRNELAIKALRRYLERKPRDLEAREWLTEIEENLRVATEEQGDSSPGEDD